MKKEVDDKLKFANKVTKEFPYALIRKNPSLNTALLCEQIYQILLKKTNVVFKLGSMVSSYQVDGKIDKHGARKGKVDAVVLNYQDRFPVDDVVICVGPFARKHIKE